MARRKKSERCAYCLQVGPVTREHVVPRCLFPKPLPGFMVTVPVCATCNQSKGKLDVYLRDVLVLDADSAVNEHAQQLLDGEVARAIRKNRSEVARVALAKGRLEPQYTPGGIYLGHAVSFPIDGERITRVMSLIARGLYLERTKAHLPIDCNFDVRRVHPLEFREAWECWKRIKFNGPYTLGDNIVQVSMMYAKEEPALSLWWFWFYESIYMHVGTSPDGMGPIVPSPR